LEPPNDADIVDGNGKVLPPSLAVFKDLSKALIAEYPTITPKNIYIIILSRRYNIYDRLMAALVLSMLTCPRTQKRSIHRKW